MPLDEENTGKRDAVRINSGQPVDHSGPGLGRANTLTDNRAKSGGLPSSLPEKRDVTDTLNGQQCVTPPVSSVSDASGGLLTRQCGCDCEFSLHGSSAHPQPKSGPEVQEPGGFLGAGEARPVGLRSEAEQPTSLDQIQINRNNGRGKHCGRFSVRGHDERNRQIRYHRVNCKCWNCSYCGPRKAKRYKHAIRRTAEAHKLNRFLTLTLDPKRISGDAVTYLNATFAKLRVYWKRKYGVSPKYIRVLEFQKNGNPHFHVLIDRFIPQAWIQEAWTAVGGGRMVDIRYVDLHQISRYLSKYLTKELLLSAPKRSRRVTTARGIKLLGKSLTQIAWTLIRVPIWRLYEVNRYHVVAVSLDEEQILEAFSIAD